MLSMVLQAIELCKELKLDFIEINMNLPQYQKNNIDINMKELKKYGFANVFVSKTILPFYLGCIITTLIIYFVKF